MRRRRKIRYYNGPAYEAKITQKVWFPFVATALAALVLGLVLGLILNSVSSDSKLARLPARDLVELGGVEAAAEKYEALLAVNGSTVDPTGLGESDLKKAVAVDGNAAGLLLFNGKLHYDSKLSLGYEGGGLSAEKIASAAEAKSRYSVALFVSEAFEEADTAKRAYEKGRELALLCEIAAAGFREILILGLPCEEGYANEVALYLSQVRDFSPRTYVGVALPGGAGDAEIARLVASAEAVVDSFALDLHELSASAASDAVARNAYYLTQYNMRVLCASDSTVALDYNLSSVLVWGKE